MKNLLSFIFFFNISIIFGQEKEITNELDLIFSKIQYFKKNNNSDSALYYCDKLIEKKAKHKDRIVNFYKEKMTTLIHFNRAAEAYEIGVNTIENYCSKSFSNCLDCSLIIRLQSDILFNIRDYDMAITYLDMDCRQNDPIWLLKKAGLYQEKGDTETVLKIIRNSKTDHFSDNEKVVWIFGTGILERKLGNNEIALEVYFNTLKLIDSTQAKTNLKPTVLGNIGETYWVKGEIEKAAKYLQLDSDGSYKNGNFVSYTSAEIYLGRIDMLNNDHEKVITRFVPMLENFSTYMPFDSQIEVTDLLLTSYDYLEKKKEYYQLLNKKTSIIQEKLQLDSKDYQNLIQNYASNAVQTVEKKMELDKKVLAQEIIIIEEREHQTKIRNWIIITSLIFILIVGSLLFRKYKSENKKKAQLKDAQLKLSSQEQEILALKIQEEERNVQELSLELNIKGDFVSLLSAELKKIDALTSSERRNLEIFIQTELEIKSVRAELQETIENSEGRFISKLKILHGNLTDNDIRLALLIVLKHSNKEISIKKNITPESVKISKNRLKKKLMLSKENNLTEYLKGILHNEN